MAANQYPDRDNQNFEVSTNTSTQQRWQQAVVQAAAVLDNPQYSPRLQAAMDLVLTGSVTLHEDGTATVKSGGHIYPIDPEQGCPCPDAEFRTPLCKHVTAVALHKLAWDQMAQAQPQTSEPERPKGAWCHG